ncbi:PLP-dependent aminotransferase family protein [Roseibium sp.]|uniref:aminotransferase-like domain-containing protein n=1 Tax=Roseibium sp. TaxID=1936156 RepID=UPI003D0E5322
MTDWCPDLTGSNAPRYLAIADAIDADIRKGKLKQGDRLPAQRQLAGLLDLDFTTVARGYAEARRRGIISSQVGSGTYVTPPSSARTTSSATSDPRRPRTPDPTMNLPPEVQAPDLIERLQQGFASLSADLVPLMRYQTLEASEPDRQAACSWLSGVGLSPEPEAIQFSPGAQAALSGILAAIASPGDRIACEEITYPGIRSICAQQHLELQGLKTDSDGIDPDAFQAACLSGTLKALYVNPTLQNPTTRTVPHARRRALAAIARKHAVPILEDDAYGQLSRTASPPFAAIAPELTWYIGSLAKSLGAGLRLAYVLAPDKNAAWQFSRAVRTFSVMTSPLSTALATRWIEDGTAEALLAYLRKECTARQTLAAGILKDQTFEADPDGFHLWLRLPAGWTRSSLAGQMRGQPIGIAESDAFTVSGTAPEAVRVCLGGPLDRTGLKEALEVMARTLQASPQSASAFF